MRGAVFAVTLVVALAGAGGGFASADTAQQSAARTFHEGERAFSAGEYARAATLFEEAYAVRPHPSSLWNAAHAHAKAGDRARAAKLYARLLREAPTSTEAIDAKASLELLTSQLGRLRVRATPEIRSRTVDGVVVEDDETVFVEPGSHAIEGAGSGGVIVRKSIEVSAGALVVVPLALGGGSPPAAAPKEPTEPAPASHGLAPIFVIVGGAATLVAGGVTLWSGLDVAAQRRTYEQTSSEADFAAGQDKQLRTNVLLGATIGLAVITGVTALFTDFGAPVLGRSAKLRVIVGGIDGVF
jgi:tetratricopeptide (TPR) repeat protein